MTSSVLGPSYFIWKKSFKHPLIGINEKNLRESQGGGILLPGWTEQMSCVYIMNNIIK